MARTVWIGILTFGLFLFVSLDLFLLWYLVTSKSGAQKYGGLLFVILSTWQVYVALKKRIDSKPNTRIVEHPGYKTEGDRTISWQQKP